MKRFTLLRTIAGILEGYSYLALIGGAAFILIMGFNGEIDFKAVSILVWIVYWLLAFLPVLVTAHLIKLGLAYYDNSEKGLDLLREMTFELKSKKSEQSNAMSNWIKENPGKSLNEFYAEVKQG